ncbi:hypothetical protein J6590_064548 [Homalodisca vitripennis]|nr:hypothetical protein J6590_064548 [Homalodisca vitripennis]
MLQGTAVKVLAVVEWARDSTCDRAGVGRWHVPGVAKHQLRHKSVESPHERHVYKMTYYSTTQGVSSRCGPAPVTTQECGATI